jgi:DNA-binding transcriptional LysR family regulator
MRNLNLDQLRALLDVVELGSFSAAARKLNLTQPAVSIQIRELENRLGVPLVARIGRRAFATEAGRELIDNGRGIFEWADRAMAAVRRHKEGGLGHLNLGAGLAALSYVLLPAIESIRQKHPTLDLSVSTGNTEEVIERLIDNRLDLGVTALPIHERLVTATAFRQMTMVAILPATAAAPAAIRPADLAARPLIVTQQRSNNGHLAREWLRSAGFELKPAMEIDNFDAIKGIVAAGLGVAIVPRDAVDHGEAVKGIVSRPLDPPLSLTLALVRLRSKPDTPSLRIVQDAILALADEV